MQTIDTRKTINPKSPRFFDQLKLFIRHKGLSYSTEKTILLMGSTIYPFQSIPIDDGN
jgi:hypothetical protein